MTIPLLSVPSRTSVWAPGPACLSTLVSASWTMRYANRSTRAGSSAGTPSVASETSRPAPRICSTSRGRSARPGWGPSPSRSALWSEDPEQVAQLVQRLASRLLHRSHRLQGALRVLGGHGLGRARLHRHQAHPVGDHVVQLARDAGPLLGHDPAGLGGLFPQQLVGALLAQPEPAPDVPRHEHDDAAEDGLPPRGRVVEEIDADHGDGRGDAHLAPPVLGGVPPRAVQGDDRHPAESASSCLRASAPRRPAPRPARPGARACASTAPRWPRRRPAGR